MQTPSRRFATLIPAVLLLAGLACVTAATLGSQEPPPVPPGPQGESPAPPPEPAPGAPPDPAPAEPPAAAPETIRSPGMALSFFMASRDSRTIRDLKSVMTPTLRTAYDHDSAPFNGRKGIRLAAFDFREPMPKADVRSVTVVVKSLWEDQGEAVELRTENAKLEREASGNWLVGGLNKAATESLRYGEAIGGVTALRMILRSWQRRDLEAAKSFMSDAFRKRFAGREEGFAAVFGGDPAVRRAAFRIVDLQPRGTTAAVARVRLVEAPAGRPSGLEGTPRTVELEKKGSRLLLNDWK